MGVRPIKMVLTPHARRHAAGYGCQWIIYRFFRFRAIFMQMAAPPQVIARPNSIIATADISMLMLLWSAV